MRITLETTTEHEQSARRIVIEKPYDDYTTYSLAEELLIPLLLAWGYNESNVHELFGIDEETTGTGDTE